MSAAGNITVFLLILMLCIHRTSRSRDTKRVEGHSWAPFRWRPWIFLHGTSGCFQWSSRWLVGFEPAGVLTERPFLEVLHRLYDTNDTMSIFEQGGSQVLVSWVGVWAEGLIFQTGMIKLWGSFHRNKKEGVPVDGSPINSKKPGISAVYVAGWWDTTLKVCGWSSHSWSAAMFQQQKTHILVCEGQISSTSNQYFLSVLWEFPQRRKKTESNDFQGGDEGHWDSLTSPAVERLIIPSFHKLGVKVIDGMQILPSQPWCNPFIFLQEGETFQWMFIKHLVD